VTALVIFLLVLFAAAAIVGFIVKALLWLAILGLVAFVITFAGALIFGKQK
jgi:hypothetical protein